MTVEEATDRMTGKSNTKLSLRIARIGVSGLLSFDLLRAASRASFVTSQLLPGNVGLIRVTRFVPMTTPDVTREMKELAGKGARAWILDLRGNQGGILDAEIDLTDLFVDAGTMATVVSRDSREPRRATHGFGDASSPLAIVVDRDTSSGAELVAIALQELHRAVVIGERTQGNALIQEEYPNKDGGKLSLTASEWLPPSGRSIQALGVTPDIAVYKLSPPQATASAGILAPSLGRGWTPENEARSPRLVSSSPAKPGQPSLMVTLLAEEAPSTADAAAGAIGDELVAPEIRLAGELLSMSRVATRSELINQARPLAARLEAEAARSLYASLKSIGVDWSPPPADPARAAALEITLRATPDRLLDAGGSLTITAAVKNAGTSTVWRAIGRLRSDDPLLDGYELPIGKVLPGETRSFTGTIQIPQNAINHIAHLHLEVTSVGGAKATTAPVSTRIKAAPRPVLAYAYQLLDDGNGDGLIQKGENHRLAVSIMNTGEGISPDVTVVLGNFSGGGVTLGKSRNKLGPLAPRAVRVLEIPIAVARELPGDRVSLALMVYDATLEAPPGSERWFRAPRLEMPVFPVRPAVTVSSRRGTVVVQGEQTEIRAGASPDSPLIGWAAPGDVISVLGIAGAWTKLELGDGRPGFISSSAIAPGAGKLAFRRIWQSTPPSISLKPVSLEVSGDSYSFAGTVTDDSLIKDVYVLISNPAAKISSRKVYYRAAGKDETTRLDFEARVPLWPGANHVKVVARDSLGEQTSEMMIVHAGR